MSTDLNDKNTESVNTDEYTYQPRSRNRKSTASVPTKEKSSEPKTKKGINKWLFIVPGAIIALVLVAILSYTLTLPDDVIASNVKIAGVDVSGMSADEARFAIDGLVSEDSVFQVTSAGHSTDILATDISLEVDYDATVEKAMSICKTNNIFIDAYNAVYLLFSEKDLNAEMIYNVEKLDKLLFDFGATFNGLSTEQQYTYTEDSLTVIPATAGQNPDVSVARGEFIKGVGYGKTSEIEVTLDYADPKLLDAEVVYNEICVPAQDATYARDEEGQVIINEHKVGVEVKKEDLKNVISLVNEGKTATCNAVITMPEKTKEELEEKLFNDTLGTYTTNFSSSSANRAYNVSLASDSINDVILMPGEEFSYNNTIGNPNAERGYKIAGIYENGKTSEGVGGGICQVSSTLYSAVLYADLEIVERHNHSLTVPYVPNGQDATVSYGVIDFRFKNNTQYPVKVQSTTNNRNLKVSIIGTKYEPERKVRISHQLISTTTPVDEEKVDETLPAGTRKVVSKGKNGCVVDTYKTILENGVEVSSKKITRSTYRMVPNEVLVSAQVVEETPVEDQPVNAPVDEEIVEGLPEETIPDTTIKPIQRPTPNSSNDEDLNVQ